MDTVTSGLNKLSQLASESAEKLSQLVPQIEPKYLNPLQCQPFSKCKLFVYFIIGMIAVFTLLLLFRASKLSKFSLLLSTLCLCIVFIACSLLLLNLCVAGASDILSYITLGVSILVIIIIIMFFKPQ